MKIEIIEVRDTEDGGAILTLDMDHDTLVTFAKKGILDTLREARCNITKEHVNSVGSEG
jgi:hypothetical protein